MIMVVYASDKKVRNDAPKMNGEGIAASAMGLDFGTLVRSATFQQQLAGPAAQAIQQPASSRP